MLKAVERIPDNVVSLVICFDFLNIFPQHSPLKNEKIREIKRNYFLQLIFLFSNS